MYYIKYILIIQIHRLSTELITTSNKISELEKIIEKVIVTLWRLYGNRAFRTNFNNYY